MMKSILLCEGKSDAILVSYYLNKVKGWEFYGKKDKRKVTIPIREMLTGKNTRLFRKDLEGWKKYKISRWVNELNRDKEDIRGKLK